MIAATPERPSAVTERDAAWRSRARILWLLAGFGAGIALDLVVTAIQVAKGGYTLLDAPQLLLWNLILAPYLGTITGLIGLIRSRSPSPWKWRRPRFRTWTLMVVVAYLAFLFGPVPSSLRLNNVAASHDQKAINCVEMAKMLRECGRKSESEAKLRGENVAQLQAGQIPESLFPGQADFLRTLEDNPKITPVFREYRRGLIQKTQVDAGVRAEASIAFSRRIVEYHERLAAKYDRARWRPWLPVEPDPPIPR